MVWPRGPPARHPVGVKRPQAGSVTESSGLRGGTMTASTLFDQDVVYGLREAGQQLRVDTVRCSSAAGSGHPTSSLSAADLMAVLLARRLRYDFDDPRAPGNDHLIFS